MRVLGRETMKEELYRDVLFIYCRVVRIVIVDWLP